MNPAIMAVKADELWGQVGGWVLVIIRTTLTNAHHSCSVIFPNKMSVRGSFLPSPGSEVAPPPPLPVALAQYAYRKEGSTRGKQEEGPFILSTSKHL